jgi:hypothetical protein
VKSTNHRFRVVTIFRRVGPAAPLGLAAGG